MRIIFINILILVCIVRLFSQDLLERTINDIKYNNLKNPNLIAEDISTEKSKVIVSNLFKVNSSLKANRYSEFTDNAIYLDLNEKELLRLTKTNSQNLKLTVPVNSKRSFNLLLEQVDILSPDYKMETSDGEIIYPDRSKMLFYRGIVDGDGQSIATLSIVHGKLRALISDNNGNYILGELPKEKGRFVLYNDVTLKKTLGTFCKTVSENHNVNKQLVKDRELKYLKSIINPCVPIYIEADYQMYLDNGSDTSSVETYIMSLFNEVSTIYANDSIKISISTIFVWKTADSYNMNNVGIALEQFANRIMDNYNGRLTHLISTKNNYSGIAWIDVLYSFYTPICLYDCPGNSDPYDGFYFECGYNPNCCNFNYSCLSSNPAQESGPYAVSAGLGSYGNNFPTFSWDVYVFAHEMGHNFGSNHTQACVWNNNNTAIDGCYPTEGGCGRPAPNCPSNGGTIMSYCHLNPCNDLKLANGFGLQPGNLIRNRYNNPQNGITLECVVDESNCLSIDTTFNSVIITQNDSILTTGLISTINAILIQSPAAVFWQSQMSVVLGEGFSIEAGAQMTISIGDCTVEN